MYNLRCFGFDIDIQVHIREGQKDFFQGRDGDALATIGESLPAILGPGITGVQLLQIGQREIVDKARAIGGRFDERVVAHHDHPICGALEVHFERVRAQFERLLEGEQGIRRPAPLAAAVSH